MKHFFLCCLLLVSGMITQAQTLIKGTVFDQDRNPLTGATVRVKGMNEGSIADLNGDFTVRCKSLPATVEISFIGMAPKNIVVRSERELPLKVILEEMQNEIDEVVVIGYGAVRKSDLTGSVASVKGKDINESRMLSFDQAMAGRMAGVNITNTGGEPGAGISIQIRGVGSINSDSDPLYVIDGAPISKDAGTELGNIAVSSAIFNPLASLNPSDIQSIEVLKDASATAIYGSRGANGVVLITTKSGMEGKPRVSFSTYVGVGQVSKKIDMLEGQDYLDYMAYEREDADYVAKYDSLSNAPFHNWQDELYKNSITQEYNIGVRGGTKTTKYALSAAYTDQQGLVDNSGFDRFTLRARVDQNIGKSAKVGVNMTYAKMGQDGIPSGGSKDTGADVFQQVLSYRPANVRSNFDENGDLSGDYNLQTNPKDYIAQVKNRLDNMRFTATTYAQYEFIKGLLFKTSYNINTTYTDKNIFYPPTVAAGASTNGRGINTWAKRFNWSWENILTYDVKLNKNHSLNAMVGYTMEAQNGRNFSIEANDYPEAFLGLEGGNVGFGLLTSAPTVSDFRSTLISYLGRINYSYKGKYLLTASIRSDGSSKFPKGSKFAYFPSAAVAWNIHKESFMQPVKNVISDLKLRFSYGRTGNQSIPNYSSQSVYQDVYYTFNEAGGLNPSSIMVPGIGVTSIANPKLTWETTEQYNGGIDLSFFRQRLSVSIDAYYKKTFDLLLKRPLDFSTGFATMMFNSGSLENKGIELVINSINFSTKDFTWTTAFNISFNRNKVLNLGKNAQLTFSAGNVYNEAFILEPGHAVGTMYGYVYDGVYQYKDYKNFYVNNDPAQGMRSSTECQEIYNRAKAGQEKLELMDGQPKYAGDVPLPGSAKFRDIVGDDGNVTSEDRTYIGNSEPKFQGGFVNKFNYKGFDLSVFMQFSYGNKMFVTNYFALQGYNSRNMRKDIYDNAWRPYRESNAWPDYMIDSYKTVPSGLYIEDGSYLKIKDITLGYTLPTQWLGKLGIAGARIYVTGQNLFTFTDFKWYDPEIASSSPITGGMYKFVYPSSRTFITGLSIDF